jgi:hypothetical protein
MAWGVSTREWESLGDLDVPHLQAVVEPLSKGPDPVLAMLAHRPSMAVRPTRLCLTETLVECVDAGTGHHHDRLDVGAWVGQVGHRCWPSVVGAGRYTD